MPTKTQIIEHIQNFPCDQTLSSLKVLLKSELEQILADLKVKHSKKVSKKRKSSKRKPRKSSASRKSATKRKLSNKSVSFESGEIYPPTSDINVFGHKIHYDNSHGKNPVLFHGRPVLWWSDGGLQAKLQLTDGYIGYFPYYSPEWKKFLSAFDAYKRKNHFR